MSTSLRERRILLEYEAERERILFALTEIDEKIRLENVDLAVSSSKYDEDISENGSNSKPDFAEGFGGDFGGFSDGDPVEVDNNGLSSDNVGGDSGSQNPQRKINRKRKRTAPPLTRERNLRHQERVNYNVGSPLRKHRRNKPFQQPASSPPPESSGIPFLVPSSPQISLPPLSPRDIICNHE
ncbi:16610_t:CDS:2, partial [Funneliformis caledonium]